MPHLHDWFVSYMTCANLALVSGLEELNCRSFAAQHTGLDNGLRSLPFWNPIASSRTWYAFPPTWQCRWRGLHPPYIDCQHCLGGPVQISDCQLNKSTETKDYQICAYLIHRKHCQQSSSCLPHCTNHVKMCDIAGWPFCKRGQTCWVVHVLMTWLHCTIAVHNDQNTSFVALYATVSLHVQNFVL